MSAVNKRNMATESLDFKICQNPKSSKKIQKSLSQNKRLTKTTNPIWLSITMQNIDCTKSLQNSNYSAQMEWNKWSLHVSCIIFTVVSDHVDYYKALDLVSCKDLEKHITYTPINEFAICYLNKKSFVSQLMAALFGCVFTKGDIGRRGCQRIHGASLSHSASEFRD